MSLSAAGDLVRRLKAVQPQIQQTPPEPAADTPPPVLTIVGTGVTDHG